MFEVTDDTFERDVLQADVPIVLEAIWKVPLLRFAALGGRL